MKKSKKLNIEQYEHLKEERSNIPHVGLVTPESDPETGEKKTYEYDPHLDPQLQWAGKKEHTSFEVPTVSLHVHERIDPKTIIETVKKEKYDGGQMSLFSEKKPLREAIDFYKHKEGWTNRLIAGDSLLVMNSLLEKEGMGGKVQMVYFDPPYGIKYGSNFMPFINKKEVKDGKDEDLNTEPEMIKAFRDTWELGVHSFLNFFRDRIKLSHQLLNNTGSIFIQISDENQHFFRNILDEVFGYENHISTITYKTKIPLGTKYIANTSDYILWYAKSKSELKFNRLFKHRNPNDYSAYDWVEESNGNRRPLTSEEKKDKLKVNGKLFWPLSLFSSGRTESCVFDIEFNGEVFSCTNKSWKTNKEGINELLKRNRIIKVGKQLRYVLYLEDYPIYEIDNNWTDTINSFSAKNYVVETNPTVIKRCINMATDPGDIVFDPTCGGGTTAFVSENEGRRWITCDTSRISISLTKKRLITSVFDYFKLSHPNEGISSGLEYSRFPHITLGSITNNLPTPYEEMVDSPIIDPHKSRITGPFTVESVPSLYTKNFESLENENLGEDNSVTRSGETNRQSEWRDELLKTGVRTKGGNKIEFNRVEPISGTKFIQAEAETKEDIPKRVLVVFGPEHAPLEQRTVENAWQEARSLKPDMLLFCAFQFDEEAAKDIDELTPSIAGMTLLKVQINADLLTDDLRKNRSSNESFWLVGQPDIQVHKLEENKIQVEVMGFDYYNPKTGNVESGGKKNISMWMLDTDYDNRSLFPSQLFFPMSGNGDGWDKLSKNLKSEIDEEKIESFKGTISLPFEPGSFIAVKIIDDRGIESLRVLNV